MKERVLNYMVEFGSITTWDAFRDLGCTRLSEYIRQLRETIMIDDEWLTAKNRYGEPVHYKRYWITKRTIRQRIKDIFKKEK